MCAVGFMRTFGRDGPCAVRKQFAHADEHKVRPYGAVRFLKDAKRRLCHEHFFHLFRGLCPGSGYELDSTVIAKPLETRDLAIFLF